MCLTSTSRKSHSRLDNDAERPPPPPKPTSATAVDCPFAYLDRSDIHLNMMSLAARALQSVSLNDVAEETGTGYGIEIAHLQKASEMLAQAFRLAQR